MICPILSIGTLVKGDSHTNCAKDECEWWNPLIKGCDPAHKFPNIRSSLLQLQHASNVVINKFAPIELYPPKRKKIWENIYKE